MPDRVPFINPKTGEKLRFEEGVWVGETSGEKVAEVIEGIPRFVSVEDNYAENFGWQWNHWKNDQSESRGAVKQKRMLLNRTKFKEEDVEGKSILECGMGGGDDTEVLLTLPFEQIHSFDLSSGVNRASEFLKDERLTISQASILDIPYPDESFDYVFCHRVLMHTPDPEHSLRCIAKKVKPGGILFAHSYKRSDEHMREWRYKYRLFAKKYPQKYTYWYVKYLGFPLHFLVELLYRIGGPFKKFAYERIPFFYLTRKGAYKMPLLKAIEFEKLVTFDALTPEYDNPMSTEVFTRIIEEEGFEFVYLEDGLPSPIYGTARKKQV